jgi:hypothetical protein
MTGRRKEKTNKNNKGKNEGDLKGKVIPAPN